jgi:hypothetical protein
VLAPLGINNTAETAAGPLHVGPVVADYLVLVCLALGLGSWLGLWAMEHALLLQRQLQGGPSRLA